MLHASGNGPKVKILQPTRGSTWNDDLSVNLEVIWQDEIQTVFQEMFVICIAHTWNIHSKSNNHQNEPEVKCFPIPDNQLFSFNIMNKRYSDDEEETSSSQHNRPIVSIKEVKVWCQHRSYSRQPSNAVSTDSIDIVHLWKDASLAIKELLKLLLHGDHIIDNLGKQSVLRSLSIAYTQQEQQQQQQQQREAASTSNNSAKDDLQDCILHHNYPRYVALKLHYEKKHEKKKTENSQTSENIRKYMYLKVPLPFPLSHYGVNNMNEARSLLQADFFAQCLEAEKNSLFITTTTTTTGVVDENWNVYECLFDLLDQYEERIQLACEPPPVVYSTCYPHGGVIEEGGEGMKRADIGLISECLKLTTPSEELKLTYPDDAEQHFAVLSNKCNCSVYYVFT
jgi:hypothetical protein